MHIIYSSKELYNLLEGYDGKPILILGNIRLDYVGDQETLEQIFCYAEGETKEYPPSLLFQISFCKHQNIGIFEYEHKLVDSPESILEYIFNCISVNMVKRTIFEEQKLAARIQELAG